MYNAERVFYPTIVVVDDDGGLVAGSFKATVGTGNPLITLPNATFGAIALLTAAFIILVVWPTPTERSIRRQANQSRLISKYIGGLHDRLQDDSL